MKLSVAGSNPVIIITSKRLLPLHTESALMPDRKESGHLEARKAKGVGVKVMQFRGLAASLRSEISREGCNVRNGKPNLPGAVGAWGTKRISWEHIIQLKPATDGSSLSPPALRGRVRMRETEAR